MRGYFLFVVVIDHIGYFPSFFELFTGRGEMWASAAEGFFIISGLLVGYIYGPRMAQNALAATQKLWKRAFLLYGLTVALTILFVWWGNISDISHVKEGLWIHPPVGEFLFKILTLQYYYGWHDFLPYYALFMAWAPLALYACVKRLGWLVVAVSIAGWLWRGSSFELSWQLLFMGSLVAGWYLPKVESWAQALSPSLKRRLTRSLYVSALVLILASTLTIRIGEVMVHEFQGFATLPPAVQQVCLWLDQARTFMAPLIVKWTLEPVRILTAAVWFGALYVFVRSREERFDRLSWGLLKKLGERSLVVYVVHAIAVFGLLLLGLGSGNYLLNTFLSAVVVSGIYITAVGWTALVRFMKRRSSTRATQLQLRSEDIS